MSQVAHGNFWRRLYDVLGPYWFGDRTWSKSQVGLSLLVVGAVIFGLNWAVSLGSAAVIGFVKSISAETMITFGHTWGPPAICLLVLGIGFNWYYRRKNPADFDAEARHFAAEPKNAKIIAWVLLATVLCFMVSVNMLNVIINYVQGSFTTALNKNNEPEYWKYLYVFAMIFVVGTPIVVMNQWFRRILGNHNRYVVTWLLTSKYFSNRAYYYINGRQDIDNPDERIHQDVQTVVEGSLSIALTFLGALIRLVAFIGILWAISQSLTWTVVVYAIFGTVVTYALGIILVSLNAFQLRYEADARFSLTRVRENTESIGFYRGEAREQAQVNSRFGKVYANYWRLIRAQRNLGFFTTGFDYVTVIVPALFLAPLYFKGQIDVGVITQATGAFNMVLGALSVMIDDFPVITKFVANIHRIGSFKESVDKPIETEAKTRIVTEFGENIVLKNVTIQTPDSPRILAKDLTVKVDPANSLLIVGPSGSGKSSILRVISGLWNSGSGLIIRPEQREGTTNMLFLPQKPYMLLGSLREQLTYPNIGMKISDQELQKVLETVNLPKVADRAGGFDAVTNWSDVLSGGEQQRMAMARLLISKPKIAILDEATSALDIKNERLVYDLLKASGTTFVSVGHRPTLTKYHTTVLELDGNGGWQLLPADEYAKNQS